MPSAARAHSEESKARGGRGRRGAAPPGHLNALLAGCLRARASLWLPGWRCCSVSAAWRAAAALLCQGARLAVAARQCQGART
jgi:hypothetical protein